MIDFRYLDALVTNKIDGIISYAQQIKIAEGEKIKREQSLFDNLYKDFINIFRHSLNMKILSTLGIRILSNIISLWVHLKKVRTCFNIQAHYPIYFLLPRGEFLIASI